MIYIAGRVSEAVVEVWLFLLYLEIYIKVVSWREPFPKANLDPVIEHG